MNEIEQRLAREFDRKYAHVTGSGTTAMYLLFRVLRNGRQKAIYPAITCSVAPVAALYAGYELSFCDVRLWDYTIDPKSFLKALKLNEDAGVVVPTHLYGHPCDIASVSAIAKKRDVFVLEDSAQTVFLSKADASIMSFGHTKILSSLGGGGVLFTDDESLYERVRMEASFLLPLEKNEKDLGFDEYRKEYYAVVQSDQTEGMKNRELFALLWKYRKIFLYAYSNFDKEDISDSLNRRAEIYKQRIEKADIYRRRLISEKIGHPKILRDTVLWRYSFLYRGNRSRLLEKVREKRIDISSWYPLMSDIFPHKHSPECPNAAYVSQQIVNLWVDEKKSAEEINCDIDEILNIIRSE